MGGRRLWVVYGCIVGRQEFVVGLLNLMCCCRAWRSRGMSRVSDNDVVDPEGIDDDGEHQVPNKQKNRTYGFFHFGWSLLETRESETNMGGRSS